MAVAGGKTFEFSTFVFDPQSGELLKSGKRLPMPDQSARLLTILIKNCGIVVTRQELRSQLWPESEFGDYDQSLNRIVSELRFILQDRSSKTPCIETLPKRGYRFVVPVREVASGRASKSILEEFEADITPLATNGPANDFPTHSREALYTVTDLPSTNPPEALFSDAALLPPHYRTKRVWFIAAIALIVCSSIAIVIATHRQTEVRPLSLGIVPFEASGGDAAQLAESFRLDLADSLSQIPKVEIRATHSFDDLGQNQALLQTRALQLGIDNMLFGYLTVTGDQCRLKLELVRSKDGVHLLSLQYSGKKEELASIRDRIEGDLFQHLHPTAQSVALSLQSPSSPIAYAAYLKGRFNLATATEDSLRLATSSFEDAIRQEPNYARAYAGASSSSYILSQRLVNERTRYIGEARAMATRAIAIDPSLAEPHAILGQIALTQDWDFNRADEELHRAIKLDPTRAAYHQWMSRLYCVRAQYNQALDEIDKAEAQDPEWNSLYITDVYIALAARLYDRADRANAVLIQRMPQWPLAYEHKGIILLESKRYAAAIEAWHYAALLDKNPDRAHLEEEGAKVFRKGGIVAYARLRLHAIATRKGISFEQWTFNPGEWHAYAGDWDEALAGLQETVDKHSSEALQIATDPAFDPLHHDPRFIALVNRIGLPLSVDNKYSTSGEGKEIGSR